MTKIDYIVHQLTAGSYYTEGGTMITCPDHMERISFRCWLDGSNDNTPFVNVWGDRLSQAHRYRSPAPCFKRVVQMQFFAYIKYEFGVRFEDAVEAVKLAFPWPNGQEWTGESPDAERLFAELVADAEQLIFPKEDEGQCDNCKQTMATGFIDDDGICMDCELEVYGEEVTPWETVSEANAAVQKEARS